MPECTCVQRALHVNLSQGPCQHPKLSTCKSMVPLKSLSNIWKAALSNCKEVTVCIYFYYMTIYIYTQYICGSSCLRTMFDQNSDLQAMSWVLLWRLKALHPSFWYSGFLSPIIVLRKAVHSNVQAIWGSRSNKPG